MFPAFGFMGSVADQGIAVVNGPTIFDFADTASVRVASFTVSAGANRLSVLLSNESQAIGGGDTAEPTAVAWFPDGTGTPGTQQALARTVTRGIGGGTDDTYHRAEEWSLADPTAGAGELQVTMAGNAALGLVARALSGVGGAPITNGATVEESAALGPQPTIRDVTFDNGGTTGTGDDVFDVAFPTGVAAGDRVIIGLMTSKESAQGAISSTITAPVITNAGTITQISSTTSTTGGRDVRLVLWEVVWNGAETGSIVVESTTTTGEASTAFALALADARTDAGWIENTPTPTTGADNPVSAPTPLTASDNNRLVVLITAYGDDSGVFVSFSGGAGADIPVVEQDASLSGADRRVAIHAVGLDTGSITGKSEATERGPESWICAALIVTPTGGGGGGAPTSISTDIDPLLNSLVLDVVSASSSTTAATPGGGQTEIDDSDVAADYRQYSSEKASVDGVATSMSWTFAAAIERAAQVVVAYSSDDGGAAALSAGTLLSAAEQPIASGLVFFAGSAPSGSSLLAREQIGDAAATLGASANLARANASHGTWLCGESTATASGNTISYPQSTALRGLTNRVSIWFHGVIDAIVTNSTIFSIPWVSGSATSPFNVMAVQRASGASTAVRIGITVAGVRVFITSTVTDFYTAGEKNLVITWDGTVPEVKFYLNGVQFGATVTVGVPTGNLDWTSTQPLAMFNYSSTAAIDEGLDGAAYSLGIWNRILSLAEVQALSNAPRLLQQPGSLTPFAVSDITLDASGTNALVANQGSDNWPLAWCSDDNQLATWGDGNEAAGVVYPSTAGSNRASMGVARITAATYAALLSNPGAGFTTLATTASSRGAGVNRITYAATPPNIAAGTAGGGKCMGLHALPNALVYMLASAQGDVDGNGSSPQVPEDHMENTTLLRSTDNGANWTHIPSVSWDTIALGGAFTAGPTALNMGRANANAQDEYLYWYSPATRPGYTGQGLSPGFHFGSADMMLARVPANDVETLASWQVYTGMSGGVPQWSSNFALWAPLPGDEANGWTLQDNTEAQPGLPNNQWPNVVYLSEFNEILLVRNTNGRPNWDVTAQTNLEFWRSTSRRPWGPFAFVKRFTDWRAYDPSIPGPATSASGIFCLSVPPKWISASTGTTTRTVASQLVYNGRNKGAGGTFWDAWNSIPMSVTLIAE